MPKWYSSTGSSLGPTGARVLRAFAEAMAPAAYGLPGAAGEGPEASEVDVVPALDRYLSHLPHGRVRQIRVALAAFDWLPFPWRFSRAELGARTEFLHRLDSSPRWHHRELLLLMKVLMGSGYGNDRRVEVAIGSEATCEVPVGTPAPVPPSDLGDLTPVPGGEECEVAIVGSGAGGAVTAAILAEAGLDVLVIEAGPHLDRQSYPREPLEALGALYRNAGLTIAAGMPSIPTPVGRAVGGTTVVNSGTCLRAPGEVLAEWRQRHGIEWAEDLADEYAEAEGMLDVRPVDPERMGRNGQILLEGADAMGVSHHPLSRNAGACIGCSSCPFGCRRDQKQAMHVSYLPRAVAAGARIRSGVDARELVLTGNRVTGVECRAGVADSRATDSVPYVVRASKAVIVAGGAFGTPELLLRSGVRSKSAQLGRNLRLHPSCWVGARFDDQVRAWDGVMQSYAVDEWLGDGILLEATATPMAFGAHWLPGVGADHQRQLASYGNVASTGVLISDRSRGRVDVTRSGELRLRYKLEPEDARRLAFGIARAAELFYAAGAREVYPQIAGLKVLDRRRIAELDAQPPPGRRLRLEAFHPLGTARMDADPALGVVGADGAVHGYQSLYVADGSLFPSSIGVNPMMTIMAMAARVARRFAAAAA